MVLALSVSQNNLFGTGQRVAVNFNTSKANRNIGFEWVNPYFTDDGISRGLEVFYRRTDAAETNASDYDLDELGAAINFGIPISEFDRVTLGFRGERDRLRLGDEPSPELEEFRDDVGDSFNIFRLTGAFTKDTRDSRLLPTRGHLTRLSAELAVAATCSSTRAACATSGSSSWSTASRWRRAASSVSATGSAVLTSCR